MKFVIGDIHSEVTKLKVLIERIDQYHPTSLIFLGDYMDKGQHAKETLNYLLELSKNYECHFLMGNHEEALFANDYNWLAKYGGQRTLESFGLTGFQKSDIQKAIINPYKIFFEQLKKDYRIDGYYCVHTGPGSRYNFLESRGFDKNEIILFGHTAFYYPYYDGRKIGLDTGPAYFVEAPLTAFCLDERFFVNSNQEIFKLEQLALNCCPSIIRNHEKSL